MVPKPASSNNRLTTTVNKLVSFIMVHHYFTRLWLVKNFRFLVASLKVLAETVWYGIVWFDIVWYRMVWYGMVWYGLDGKGEMGGRDRKLMTKVLIVWCGLFP